MAILPLKLTLRERGKASWWRGGGSLRRDWEGKVPQMLVLTQASLVRAFLDPETDVHPGQPPRMASPACDFMGRHRLGSHPCFAAPQDPEGQAGPGRREAAPG